MLEISTHELSSPHSAATLAEHFDLWLRLERHKKPLTSEILRFFDLDDTQLTTKELQFPEYELPNLHRAVRRCLPDWQMAFEGGHSCIYSQVLWAPLRKRFEIRPGKFASYLVNGSRFFQLPDGSRRVLVLEDGEFDEVFVYKATLIAPRTDEQRLAREVGALVRWTQRHHYLRRQALRASATLLGRKTPVGWDDVVLEPAVRAALHSNVIGLLEQRALFRQNGIPLKRGILLYGPPGTGKTMVGKVLADISGATFIWVTAADFLSENSVRHLFKLARKLKPTIVFLEDLDLYAGERGGAASVTLGELLSQMDGLEENDGLIVVATTNDLSAIEPAMRDRPSRFDVVLEIGLPQIDARRQILTRHVARQMPGGDVLERAAVETAGLSGAQLREVAFLAVQQAILRGDVQASGVARLVPADVTAAIEKLTGGRKQTIGFRAHG